MEKRCFNGISTEAQKKKELQGIFEHSISPHMAMNFSIYMKYNVWGLYYESVSKTTVKYITFFWISRNNHLNKGAKFD